MKYENLIFEVYHEIFEEQNLFSKLPVELLIKIFKYNSEEQKKQTNIALLNCDKFRYVYDYVSVKILQNGITKN